MCVSGPSGERLEIGGVFVRCCCVPLARRKLVLVWYFACFSYLWALLNGTPLLKMMNN